MQRADAPVEASDHARMFGCGPGLPWYMSLPVINVLYDIFFDEPPEREAVKDMLDLFGLVAALMFTVRGPGGNRSA